MQATQRSKLIWKLGDLLEQNIEQFAMRGDADKNGSPSPCGAAADVPLAADLFRYMAGWANKLQEQPSRFPSPTRPRQSTSPTLCAEPWVWWRRLFLEFPAVDGSLEARTGASRRKHSDPEGRQNRRLHGAPSGELIMEAGFPMGCQHRSRIWRNCRRGLGCA